MTILGISGIMLAAPNASLGAGPPIKGAGTVEGAEDIGTCNQVWAEDNLNKTFALFATTTSGTYSLEVKENGTFVSKAGPSPGACASGTNNGSTIPAGVTGKLTSQWDNTVTATSSPNPDPNCSNNACATSTGFLNAVFGPGNWTKGEWSWNAHYTAPGGHGTWF
ncbi:MAG: hypothetical protein ACYDA6_06805, partial [Solirubrobacteraceae bacterium]